MKHPIGYASFSSDQLPVEDFRVGAGSEEIVSAVRKADRLYILSMGWRGVQWAGWTQSWAPLMGGAMGSMQDTYTCIPTKISCTSE